MNDTAFKRLAAATATLIMATATGLQPARAQTSDRPDRAFTIKPVVVDGSKSTGSTVGLEYSYFYHRATQADSNDAGVDVFDFQAARLSSGTVEVRGSGTLAASAERNPNKLLDLGASLRMDRSVGDSTIVGGGARLKAETDQSFDDKQYAYSLELHGAFNNPLGPEGWLLTYLNFGRVDPRGDAARSKALRGASLSAFRRWDLEAFYHLNLKGRFAGNTLRSLELQYRHFQEMNAPAAIESAGLDRHRLGTVRLNFGENLFVAYSKGSLPFDKQADRSVKIGFAYQLK